MMYLVSSDEWDDALNGIDEVGPWPAFFVIHLRVLEKGRRKTKGTWARASGTAHRRDH